MTEKKNKEKHIPSSHGIVNKSPNARSVIPPYKLFVREVPKAPQIIQAFAIPVILTRLQVPVAEGIIYIVCII